jgi:cyclopropane fatty-acyl-phospholipid synthase-like methyltransferase
MYQRLVAGRLEQLGVEVMAHRDRASFNFSTGEQFELQVHSSKLWRDWVLRGSLGLGETFVDKKWDIDTDQLEPFLRALMQHGSPKLRLHEHLRYSFLRALGVGPDANNPDRSYEQSSQHYDRGNDLFESFLDKNMVYSCAFFDNPKWDLERAQQHKIDVTLDRLDLFEGAHVLDIGCGWGATAIEAAQRGSNVTGITLAKEQINLARERAAKRQMNIDFQVADYRPFADEHAGKFDRIVSIGMFEHVGGRQHKVYFDAIRRLLKPGGRALVHSIVDWPFGPVIPWLERYIFQGGESPKAQDMIASATAVGLRVRTGPYRHSGIHYASTLAEWRKRFLANYHTLDNTKYPEPFKRQWLLYLAGSEAGFRGTSIHNAQVVYEKWLSD